MQGMGVRERVIREKLLRRGQRTLRSLYPLVQESVRCHWTNIYRVVRGERQTPHILRAIRDVLGEDVP